MTPLEQLPTDTDVAIVGAGPTGVTLAHALARQGIRVCVIDRNIGVLPIPRAIHIDGETMRIFHRFGLARPLLRVMRPGGQMQWVNAQGEVLLVRKGVEGLGVHGWHNDYYYHQPEMEAVIRKELTGQSTACLVEGWAMASLNETGDGVALGLQAAEGSASHTLNARYVVGADGARSTVRSCIDADDFEDLGEHQAWLVVDGLLERPLDLPEFSVQHCDPRRPSTSIYVNPLRRRWELMLLPGEDAEAMTAPEKVWQLLAPWVRPGQATLERAATYMFHSLVAKRWQKGRVFLAGDAAHQTPPFLGQGLCAAIRDVGNLAWKLSAVLGSDKAPARWLDSYGPERTPHAHAFIALAVEVGRVIQELDPQKALERDARLLREGLAFSFPAPALGAGLHRAREGGCPAIATVVPQFRLPDGQWTDDAAGANWLLIHRDGAAISSSALHAASEQGLVVQPAATARMVAWLDELSSDAAIIRPDQYLFDACSGSDALMASLKARQEMLS